MCAGPAAGGPKRKLAPRCAASSSWRARPHEACQRIRSLVSPAGVRRYKGVCWSPMTVFARPIMLPAGLVAWSSTRAPSRCAVTVTRPTAGMSTVPSSVAACRCADGTATTNSASAQAGDSETSRSSKAWQTRRGHRGLGHAGRTRGALPERASALIARAADRPSLSSLSFCCNTLQ